METVIAGISGTASWVSLVLMMIYSRLPSCAPHSSGEYLLFLGLSAASWGVGGGSLKLRQALSLSLFLSQSRSGGWLGRVEMLGGGGDH